MHQQPGLLESNGIKNVSNIKYGKVQKNQLILKYVALMKSNWNVLNQMFELTISDPLFHGSGFGVWRKEGLMGGVVEP